MFWPEYRTGSCTAQACDIALAHPLQLLSSLRLYPHWAATWLKNLQRRFWFAYWIFWFVLHSQLHVHGDGQDLGNDAQDEFPGRIDGWKTDWVCNLKTSRWDSLSKESGVSCKSSWYSNPKRLISFNSCREYEEHQLRIWTFEVCARNSVISAWILVRSWWWVVETVSSAGNRRQANSN